ncbi:hypothetical protein F5Y06DRAFT_303073 [Hypoxylon sp. FL0890]|nr:hypothetical protein F5Y06DRAFT_303073 [Hypoxylon sp. FL0890]
MARPFRSYVACHLLLGYAIFRLLRCYCYAGSLFSITDQRSAIVGNCLFCSSGDYAFDDGQRLHNTSSLYGLYLNKSIDLVHPFDMSILGSTTLPSDSLTGGLSSEDDGSAKVFFYDRTSLYAYAGTVGADVNGADDSLWSFNTTDDTWRLVQVQGGDYLSKNKHGGVYASDPSSGMSFSTGSYNISYYDAHNGTLKFQSFNSGSPQWNFETTTTGIQGPNILDGATYIDFETAGSQWARHPFSDIFIYDISSNTWYLQEATGDLSSFRAEFCADVSAPPDDSGFQVTIHGDRDIEGNAALNDVYVLSIPAFQWMKVNDSNNPDLQGFDSPGRRGPKCDVLNERQLIVSGGEVMMVDGSILNRECNMTNYPPFRVLDTSSYTWRSNFDPSLEDTVLNSVTAMIGGESSGGATVKAPSMGCSSKDLETIFDQTVPRGSYDQGNRTPDNKTSATQTPGTSSLPTTTYNTTTNINLSTKDIELICIIVPLAIIAIIAMAEDQITNQWHKPELDAHYNARYELECLGPRPRELHGNCVQPMRWELPDSQQPVELK